MKINSSTINYFWIYSIRNETVISVGWFLWVFTPRISLNKVLEAILPLVCKFLSIINAWLHQAIDSVLSFGNYLAFYLAFRILVHRWGALLAWGPSGVGLTVTHRTLNGYGRAPKAVLPCPAGTDGLMALHILSRGCRAIEHAVVGHARSKWSFRAIVFVTLHTDIHV